MKSWSCVCLTPYETVFHNFIVYRPEEEQGWEEKMEQLSFCLCCFGSQKQPESAKCSHENSV